MLFLRPASVFLFSSCFLIINTGVKLTQNNSKQLKKIIWNWRFIIHFLAQHPQGRLSSTRSSSTCKTRPLVVRAPHHLPSMASEAWAGPLKGHRHHQCLSLLLLSTIPLLSSNNFNSSNNKFTPGKTRKVKIRFILLGRIWKVRIRFIQLARLWKVKIRFMRLGRTLMVKIRFMRLGRY